jgi:hypothetical protein
MNNQVPKVGFVMDWIIHTLLIHTITRDIAHILQTIGTIPHTVTLRAAYQSAVESISQVENSYFLHISVIALQQDIPNLYASSIHPKEMQCWNSTDKLNLVLNAI